MGLTRLGRLRSLASAVGSLTCLLAALAVAGTVLAAHESGYETPSWLLLAFLLVALAVGGTFSLEYRYRDQRDSLDVFEAALAPAIFMLAPAYVIVLVAAAKTASLLAQRVSARKTAFNVAQWSAAAAAGSLTFAALTKPGDRTPDELPTLVLALLVVVVVNIASLTLVFLALEPPPRCAWLRTVMPRLAANGAMSSALNISLGVLFVATLEWAPGVAVLFAVPLGLLHWANRRYSLGRLEAGRLRALQRATHALASGPDSGLPGFLEELSRSFGWDLVELVLPVGTGRRVQRYFDEVGTELPAHRRDVEGGHSTHWETGTTVTLAAALLAADMPARQPLHVTRVTRVARDQEDRRAPELSAALAAEGFDECLAAWLTGRGGRPVGLLLVYRLYAAVPASPRELETVRLLADEAASALERSDLLAAVLEERGKLAQIVTETGEGIATLTPEGTIASWNPAFERITGYGMAQIVGTRGLALLSPRDFRGRDVSLDAWCAGGPVPPVMLRIVAADGGERWLSCSYAHAGPAPRRDGSGPPAGERRILMARDVTSRHRSSWLASAETAVFEAIAHGEPLPDVLQSLAEAVARDGSYLACGVLLTAEVAGGDNSLILVATTDGALFQAVGETGTERHGSLAVRAVEAGALLHWAETDSSPRPDASEAAWSARARDAGVFGGWAVPIQALDGSSLLGAVTVLSTASRSRVGPGGLLLERMATLAAIAVERSRAHSRLRHQATRDPLTGLANRSLFLDRAQLALERAAAEGDSVVVLFLDLDRFKTVNDSLGHEFGDDLLIAVGRRLVSVLRPQDLVARFGGDEFTILCAELDEGDREGSRVAQRCQDALDAPFALGGEEVFVTASLGVATSRGGRDAETLIGEADTAMYRAKERGGRRWEMFDAQMRMEATLRLATLNEMHRGLERGEFEVFYQPIVALRAPDRLGAEALVRWRHPTRGLIGPEEFIALAESTGLIVNIGTHVLREACTEFANWRRGDAVGAPRSLSVNISAREFSQPGLVERVAEALADSGTDPAVLTLEITESVLVDDPGGVTAATMRELRGLGVNLAIDDFGTGYSSLTWLQKFPVTALKVDQSFVAGLAEGADDAVIVAAVVSLAHSLGISAVAEGVETPEQLRALRALGCDYVQGFLLGRPEPPRDFHAYPALA